MKEERDGLEIENLRDQLYHCGKMKALGELAAMLMHEINNSLGSILGIADVLSEEIPKESPAYKDLENMRKGVLQARAVTLGILGFGRHHEFVMKPVGLVQAAEEVAALCEPQMRARNIRLERDYGSEAPLVEGSCSHLQQVFLNLILNAMEAMKEGGVLTIRVKSGEGTVRISFCDTGCGIPAENIPKIFDAFFTTKGEEGNGLGLALTRDIVRRHGGMLEAASSGLGCGAVFTVALPVSRSEAGIFS